MTGIFFNGQQLVTPTAATMVNNAAMLPVQPGIGNKLALVGHAEGGQPQTPIVLSDPTTAKATLISGDLLDAVLRCLNPSKSVNGGPTSVTVVRVDEALQSALALRDGAAAVVINLVSTNYGRKQNQVKVKVEAATGGVGRKITTAMGTAQYVGDNIYRNAFSIQYTGAQASAVLQVSDTTVTLQAPSGTTVATADLNTYATVQELVDYLNTTPGFAASVLDGNGNAPALNGLDAVAAQDVKTSLYTATAHLQAIVDWFNNSGEPFCSATRAAGAGTLPVAIGFTYLAGGTDGTSTNTDWSNAINVLQTVDVQWVVPLSNDPAIHAMVDAHVQFMSTTGRKERRGACGTPLATAVSAALPLAKAINSNRTSLINIGGYDYDLTGVLSGLVLYNPFICAAMFAATFCGMNPGTPGTGKVLNLQGLETALAVPTDTDTLLLGGVVPLADEGSGPEIIQSITTWLVDDSFNNREQSVGVALDYACRSIREAVEKACKGKKGSPTAVTTAVETMVTICSTLAKPEEQGGVGVLAGDTANPAYKGITATLTDDVIALSGQISPVLPVNYIPITINAVPWSGTATASAS